MFTCIPWQGQYRSWCSSPRQAIPVSDKHTAWTVHKCWKRLLIQGLDSHVYKNLAYIVTPKVAAEEWRRRKEQNEEEGEKEDEEEDEDKKEEEDREEKDGEEEERQEQEAV